MSVEAVKWAMNDAPMLRTDKGKPDTTSRHVLAALAEHAHSNGRNAYPAVPLLQWKTGYSRRTVQEALGRLEAAGLIEDSGTRNGATVWALAMHLQRPASDKAEINAETEQRRAATAARVRRHRSKDVTLSDGVTVTPPNSVTEPDVTPFDGVRNAVEQRYVTPSDAPKPSVEPSRESLSPPVPQQARHLAAVPDERENFTSDADTVAAAWTTARGSRNSKAAAAVAESASHLIADGWATRDLVAMAEHMARTKPGFTDLTKHEGHWQASRTTGAAYRAPTF